MALNGQFCADVPLRNYSLTHSLHLDNRPMSNSALFYYAYIWCIAHVSWDNHFLVYLCLTIIAVLLHAQIEKFCNYNSASS